jgi:hypothetical protein
MKDELSPPLLHMDVKKHTTDRLARWSMKLLGFTYIIEHISGSETVWAGLGLLSRCEKPRNSIIRVTPIRLPRANEIEYPTLEHLMHEQSDVELALPDLLLDDDSLLKNEGRIWIYTNEMKGRILVLGHASIAGQRGVKSTYGLASE